MRAAQTWRLDQRITIERRDVARGDDYGEEIVTWTPLASCWAAVEDQITPTKGGDELVTADMRLLASRTRITLRYLAGVTTDMRVQWPARSRTFQITSMAELGRRLGLELTCEAYSA